MKRTFFTTTFIFLVVYLSAQPISDGTKKIRNTHKTSIEQELNRAKETFALVKDEFVLDSIVYYTFPATTDSMFFSKTEYVYSEGEDYERTIYLWDETQNKWIPEEKSEYTFDEVGNILLFLRKNWDPAFNDWVNSKKYSFEYNAAGLEVLFIYSMWDAVAGEWQHVFKDEYVYSQNNDITASWSWSWDELSGIWIGQYGSTWDYDASGILELKTDYGWDEILSNWDSQYKTEYTFDASGFLIETKGSNKSPISGIWTLNHNSIYFNNPLGHPEEINSFYSNDNGQSWSPTNKSEITYMNGYLQTLYLGYAWDENQDEWVFTEKHEFDWDANEYMILDKRSSWDEELSDWHLYHMTEREFTETGKNLLWADYAYNIEAQQLIGLYKQVSAVDENDNYVVRTEYSWDLNMNDWVLDGKGYYYYTFSTGFPENPNTDFQVFPNPVTSMLSVRPTTMNAYTCRVYSMQGQLLLKKISVPGATVLDMSSLSNGSYLLLIDSHTGVSRQVIIKN